MKENLTELVFILDKSGSMSGLEKDTIGGFNSFIKKQKEEAGDAILSTILFSDSFDVLHDRVNIKEVKELTNKDYFASGCTALLDAIGYSIKHIMKVHNESPNSHCLMVDMIHNGRFKMLYFQQDFVGSALEV